MTDLRESLLEQIRTTRKQCRQFNEQILSLEGKQARAAAKLQIRRSENERISNEIETMKDGVESTQRYDLEALTKEVETRETILADQLQEEDKLMRDIDRFKAALAVRVESERKQQLYGYVNGAVPNQPRDPKSRSQNHIAVLRRGLEYDLEMRERKDAHPRAIVRKRCQVHHLDALYD
jgi:chromosome segregation ATPase